MKRLARTSIEWIAAVISGTFRHRLKHTADKNPLYVNLGSAHVAPTAWLNLDRTVNILIDRVPALPQALRRLGILRQEQYDHFREGLWRRVHYWDAHYPIPLKNDVATAVYSSHLLEHLDPATASNLLAECYRVLQPGGVLRVVVPDMYRINKEYVSVMDQVTRSEIGLVDDVVFLEKRMPAADVPTAFAAEYYDPDPQRQRSFGHRWMYDKWSLHSALRRVGFDSIRECRFREGQTPDLDQLDHRPENSIHVEAIKPGPPA